MFGMVLTVQPRVWAAALTPSPTSVQIATGQVMKLIVFLVGIFFPTGGRLTAPDPPMAVSRLAFACATLMPEPEEAAGELEDAAGPEVGAEVLVPAELMDPAELVDPVEPLVLELDPEEQAVRTSVPMSPAPTNED